MIKIAQAPLGGGKTYQTAKRGITNIARGQTTLILVPNHASGNEVLEQVKKVGIELGGSFAFALRGKSDVTCMTEHERKRCNRCPIFKSLFANEEDRFPTEIFDAVNGRALNLEDLQRIAADRGICVTMLTRILAFSSVPKIVVAPYSYLASGSAMDILEKIKVDEIIGDEGDTLFDVLLSSQQRHLTLAAARQTKTSTIRNDCNFDCKSCRFHFAERTDHAIKVHHGRVESQDGIFKSENTLEAAETAIAVVEKAVSENKVKAVFNFANIRAFITSLKKALYNDTPDKDPRAFIEDLKNAHKKHDPDSLVVLDEENPEKSQFAIRVPVSHPVVTEDIGSSDTWDTETSERQFRVSAMEKNIYVDEGSKSPVEIQGHVKVVLQLVDLLHSAKRDVFMLPEIAQPGIFPSCRITIRYINTAHYDRVRAYISNKARLISGTMPSEDLCRAYLLDADLDVERREADIPLHQSVLIVVHTPNEELEPQVCEFPPWAASGLYQEVQKQLGSIKALHFSPNTESARGAFELFSTQKTVTENFKVIMREKGKTTVDPKYDHFEADNRPALVEVDKLRSSTSRGVNRDEFSLCCVVGNGVARWDDRVTLYLEAREEFPHLTLSDLIRDEQERAVVQALMRAPRSAKKTVCFYAGNLHPPAFPSFMQNRIVATRDLLRGQEVPKFERSEDRVRWQVSIIAKAVADFLNGQEVVINAPTKVAVDPLRKTWCRRSDAYDGFRTHIEKCLKEKGYVDQVKDKIGERNAWKESLAWAVEQKLIKPDKQGRKEVYVRV